MATEIPPGNPEQEGHGERPRHLSNSQLNGLLSCQYRYYLERILRVDVPEIPAWWFIGGSTVHQLAERYELRRLGVTS